MGMRMGSIHWSVQAKAPAANVDAKAPAFYKKIAKAKGAAPSALEQEVAKAFFELESSSKDLTAELTDLYFVAAKVSAAAITRLSSALRDSRYHTSDER
jgi:hypothetical protein